MKQSVTSTGCLIRNAILTVASIFVLLLASCSKSKDAEQPKSAFVGVFFADGEYDLTIQSAGGNSLKIQNFGDFLNVPLNAVVDGNALTIPSQTFNNGNGNTITIVGSGVLTSGAQQHDTVTIEYAITGYTSYEGEIIAIRK